MKSVSLIIVNFNSESHTLATLRELSTRPDELPEQLIIIDNSPANRLSQHLTNLDLPIAYHATGKNLGFAGGVNLGIEYCTGQFIILLNPDACPDPGCLSGLVKVLRNDQAIGVAAPCLLSCEDKPQPAISATKSDPSLFTTLVEYTVLKRFLPKDWLQNHYFVVPGQGRDPVDCSMVQGACFAFQRSWFERIGPFDADSFFLYWEETDFCRRIRQLGGRVVYCPQLTCRHQGGASVGEDGQDLYYFWHSLYSYHRKYYGPLAAIRLRLLLIPGIAAELLILLMLSRFRHRNDSQLEVHINRMRKVLIEQFRCNHKYGTLRQ